MGAWAALPSQAESCPSLAVCQWHILVFVHLEDISPTDWVVKLEKLIHLPLSHSLCFIPKESDSTDSLLVMGLYCHTWVFASPRQKPDGVVQCIAVPVHNHFLCVWPDLFFSSAFPESSIASGYKLFNRRTFSKSQRCTYIITLRNKEMTCLIKTAVLRLGRGKGGFVWLKCLIGGRHVGTQFLSNIWNLIQVLLFKRKRFFARKRDGQRA